MPLPAGIVSVLDPPSGRYFFVTEATGASSWDDPRVRFAISSDG